VIRAPAPAKINLALAVGPRRLDGKHEVVTVLQRVDLCDRVALEPVRGLAVDGFADDTIVATALRRLAEVAGVEPAWRVVIDKRIPVAAGLGGGSSDAATALRLANGRLERPLPPERLHELAAAVGADVPFFLAPGPQLGTGDGSALEPIDLPQDYFVLLALPHGVRKDSTAAVYGRLRGDDGFDERAAAIRVVVGNATRARDLADLPPNDLARSPLATELRDRGAFRADVSGAGPTVYGLFRHRPEAEAAAAVLAASARVWITVPAWYG
jgi:4-diphosphocytidyl-2-C-methyl-D-erythritol kinase